jgi:hypothetical protein
MARFIRMVTSCRKSSLGTDSCLKSTSLVIQDLWRINNFVNWSFQGFKIFESVRNLNFIRRWNFWRCQSDVPTHSLSIYNQLLKYIYRLSFKWWRHLKTQAVHILNLKYFVSRTSIKGNFEIVTIFFVTKLSLFFVSKLSLFFRPQIVTIFLSG